MAEFPVEPKFAKVLISAIKYSCSAEALTVVSMLSVESIFFVSTSKESKSREQASRQRFKSLEGEYP